MNVTAGHILLDLIDLVPVFLEIVYSDLSLGRLGMDADWLSHNFSSPSGLEIKKQPKSPPKRLIDDHFRCFLNVL